MERRANGEMAAQWWTRYHKPAPKGIGALSLESSGVYCARRRPGLTELILNNDMAEEFTCAICLDIFASPHTVVPCGHVFCEACITKHVNNRGPNDNVPKCPSCHTRMSRSVTGRIMPSLVLANVIQKMEIRCPNSLSHNVTTQVYEALDTLDEHYGGQVELRNACNATFKVSERAAHEAQCPLAVRGCVWNKCEFTGLSAEVGRHENLCDLRTDPCWHCNKHVRSSRLESHMKHSCPERVISCSNRNLGCPGWKKGKELKAHLLYECRFEPVRPALQGILEAKEQKIKELEKEVEGLRKRVYGSDMSGPSDPLAKHMRHHPSSSQVPMPETPMLLPPQEVKAKNCAQVSVVVEDKLSQIFIKCSSKKLLSVPIFLGSDKAACLIGRIKKAWNINPEQYDLHFRGKVLDSDQTFFSQGVERDSTLEVVPNPENKAKE